jgi:hypothetical protein
MPLSKIMARGAVSGNRMCAALRHSKRRRSAPDVDVDVDVTLEWDSPEGLDRSGGRDAVATPADSPPHPPPTTNVCRVRSRSGDVPVSCSRPASASWWSAAGAGRPSDVSGPTFDPTLPAVIL